MEVLGVGMGWRKQPAPYIALNGAKMNVMDIIELTLGGDAQKELMTPI